MLGQAPTRLVSILDNLSTIIASAHMAGKEDKRGFCSDSLAAFTANAPLKFLFIR